MLTHLSIRDFAIIEALDLDLHQGFHVITGETGEEHEGGCTGSCSTCSGCGH